MSEKITVLSQAEKEEWVRTLESCEKLNDPFFHPVFYRHFEEQPYKKSFCFVYECDGEKAVYPFIKHALGDMYEPYGEYSDIEGAYGYNGVLSSSDEASFVQGFNAAFEKYCHEEKIIAEFTRFNPVYKNHLFSRDAMQTIRNNTNIVVDLTQSLDAIWMESYEHATRKNIKKAERNGLTAIVQVGKEADLHAFEEIYFKTMERRNADAFYHFNKAFFSDLIGMMSAQSLLCHVLYEGKVIASEMVLFSKEVAYSFLGGTDEEFFPMRPNDLLKHTVMQHLKKLGVKSFLLGGGNSDGDGIFRYKKSFAKHGECDFFIGKKIHDPVVYQAVVKEWESRFPDKKKIYENMVLKYRF